MEFKEIINKGIEQTINFFSQYNDLVQLRKQNIPTTNELKAKFYLLENEFSKIQTVNNAQLKYDKVGLVNELKSYLNSIEKGRFETYNTSFIFNSINQFTFNEVFLRYCEMSIWYEFNLLEMERINNTLPPQPIVKQKPELKIDQIALKYVYEGLQITRENGNKIANEYGHNSGEKLFQRFTYYSSLANRKGKPTPCTPKKLDNKIKLIESIIELLPTDKQERAKDEVSMLKKIYEAEYQ